MQGCQRKSRWTPNAERRVRCWDMRLYWGNAGPAERITGDGANRKRTVEHPFEMLKQWTDATQFLTRKLNGVSAKVSLNVLAYKLKLVMKILGISGLMRAPSA